MTQTQTRPVYDLFVVGGGINGTGIARDAAGRGLSVFLCEKQDLAQGTSSASTKLIHGGLRYLEFYEFRLVREALREREILLESAPHIIWPIEFVLPHSPSLRPMWMVKLGLFLYDHLAKRKRLGRSYAIKLAESRFGNPLKSFVKEGFVYSDCWVEDSRLVIMTALDALKHGASINTYTQFISAKRADHLWHIIIRHASGKEEDIYARYIVNAAGPRVAKVAERIDSPASPPIQPLRLIKGSHIVVPRLYAGEHAYILQHTDRRMVFVIPFEDRYSLIGTTDQPAFDAELDKPAISDPEIDYLLEAVNLYFKKGVTRKDIQYTYSGIRPLFDDGSTESHRITRDYMITLENNCVSVFGGKMTTFRRLAEEVVDRIVADDPERPREHYERWTGKAVLPGGDIPHSLSQFTQSLIHRYPFLPENLAGRYASHYGSRVHQLLEGITQLDEMGVDFGLNLYAREVDFMVRHEWAKTPDDILFRRTRLGMDLPPGMKDALTRYLASHAAKIA